MNIRNMDSQALECVSSFEGSRVQRSRPNLDVKASWDVLWG